MQKRCRELKYVDVFSVLGIRVLAEGLIARAFLPDVAEFWVVERGAGVLYPATKIYAQGIFEAQIVDR